MDALLPYGLVTPNGDRYRNIRLGPLNGHGELESSDDANPIRAVLGLLEHSLDTLGPYSRAELGEGILGRLLPLDRDFLAVQLIRETFGDVTYVVVKCPHEDCGEKLELAPDLSSVEAKALPEQLVCEVPLSDGRRIHLRLPCSADQKALHDAPPDQRNLLLLRRCRVDGDGTLTEHELDRLDAVEMGRLTASLLDRSPTLDLTAILECGECGRPFTFTYHPGEQLLASLRATRSQILREIHTLAFHYSWSLGEILDLPRTRRRQFLELIEEELTAGGPA